MEKLHSLIRTCALCFLVIRVVACGTFDPACHKTLTGNQTETIGQEQLYYNLTLVEEVLEIRVKIEYFFQENCGLDIYLHGTFYAFELFLNTILIDCKTDDDTANSLPITKLIKTGRTPVNPKYPFSKDWWDRGTVASLSFSTIAVGPKTTYLCRLWNKMMPREQIAGSLDFWFAIELSGCPSGWYGEKCNALCKCMNGATCNSYDGSCLCFPEWTGTFCETSYPHIELHPKQVSRHVNDLLHLNCTQYLLNITDSTYFWEHDGRVLQKETKSGYTIKDLNEEHSGNYTCWVNDVSGNIYNDTTSVHVEGCRKNFYGKRCDKMCNCLNSISCKRDTGCLCRSGFFGKNCAISRVVLLSSLIPICIIISVLPVALYLCWKKLHHAKFYSDNYNIYLTKMAVSELNIQPKDDEVEALKDKWTIDERLLYIGEKLGEGEFSYVFKGCIIKDKSMLHVAVKVLKEDDNKNAMIDFKHEFMALTSICHPNILRIFGQCQKFILDSQRTCMIMEYMERGCLLDLLRANRKPEALKSPLQPKHYVNIIVDVLSAMKYLEKMRYIHRDIAARNILITGDRLQAKLADFGLARDTYLTGDYKLTLSREKRIPWRWMAYESLSDNIFTIKSDVWSFGVFLWEVTSLGASPYSGIASHDLLLHLVKGYRLPMPNGCSEEWYTIMKDCWQISTEKRPTFEELFNKFHAFTKSIQGRPKFISDTSQDMDQFLETDSHLSYI